MKKGNPFAGINFRMPSMHEVTRTGKPAPQLNYTVGGAGHRPNRGARTAATDGTDKPSNAKDK